jgi:hypothetical protein
MGRQSEPDKAMKIFDCFPYWREYKHVMARKQLWESSGYDVQMIAMCGSHTHSGVCIEHSGAVVEKNDKVRLGSIEGILTRHVNIEMSGADTWAREEAQRNALFPAVREFAKPDDLIISTDADEIINPDAVGNIVASCMQNGPVSLSMGMLYYGLRWRSPNKWTHGKAFLWQDAPSDWSALRMDIYRPAVPNAGWHISWFGSSADRALKALSFAHSEFANTEGIIAIENGAKYGFDPHGTKLMNFDPKVLPKLILDHLGTSND